MPTIQPEGSVAYVRIKTPELGTFVKYLIKVDGFWKEVTKKEYNANTNNN